MTHEGRPSERVRQTGGHQLAQSAKDKPAPVVFLQQRMQHGKANAESPVVAPVQAQAGDGVVDADRICANRLADPLGLHEQKHQPHEARAHEEARGQRSPVACLRPGRPLDAVLQNPRHRDDRPRQCEQLGAGIGRLCQAHPLGKHEIKQRPEQRQHRGRQHHGPGSTAMLRLGQAGSVAPLKPTRQLVAFRHVSKRPSSIDSII